MSKKQSWLWLVLILATWACNPAKEMKTTGTIERLDPALDSIMSPNAKIEIIARDLIWSEGPLWVESEKMLLFSDVPQNVIYKWTESNGMEEYLKPSGNTGASVGSLEEGSNGLLLDNKGNLVLCQHGDRRLAVMTVPVSSPKSQFKSIADRYNGKRFNSPNDAVLRNSEYYFTDPAYGLPDQLADKSKEIPFQGVYRVDAVGNVTVLSDQISLPNGIAFSPDGKSLYVSCSDPQKPFWYKFAVNETTEPDGQRTVTVGDPNIFYDASSNVAAKEPGLPDGLKVDRNGIIYASGPGGVFIFDPNGKVLGKIKLPEAASNTALSPDEKTLYVTNDMYVLRIKMRD
jgi:gluconolactonase